MGNKGKGQTKIQGVQLMLLANILFQENKEDFCLIVAAQVFPGETNFQ